MKSLANCIYLITSIILILMMVILCCLLIKNDCHFSKENIKDLFGVIISCVALIITAFFVVMAVNAYGHIREIEEIKHKAEEVNGLVTTVTKKASELETSVRTATSKAEELNGLVATVTTKANDVETSVETATSKAEEINGLVTTITTKANDVESLVNTVTSKAEEANDLITTVTNSAKEVKKQVTDAEGLLNDIFSTMISFHEEKIKQAVKNKMRDSYYNDLTNLYRLEVYKYSRFLEEDTIYSYLLNLANLGDASDIKPIEDISNNLKMSQNIRDTAREAVKELRRRFPDA